MNMNNQMIVPKKKGSGLLFIAVLFVLFNLSSAESQCEEPKIKQECPEKAAPSPPDATDELIQGVLRNPEAWKATPVYDWEKFYGKE